MRRASHSSFLSACAALKVTLSYSVIQLTKTVLKDS